MEFLRPLDPLVRLDSTVQQRVAEGQIFPPLGVGGRSQLFSLDTRSNNKYRARSAKSSPPPGFGKLQDNDSLYIFKRFHFKRLYKYLHNMLILPAGGQYLKYLLAAPFRRTWLTADVG